MVQYRWAIALFSKLVFFHRIPLLMPAILPIYAFILIPHCGIVRPNGMRTCIQFG